MGFGEGEHLETGDGEVFFDEGENGTELGVEEETGFDYEEDAMDVNGNDTFRCCLIVWRTLVSCANRSTQ